MGRGVLVVALCAHFGVLAVPSGAAPLKPKAVRFEAALTASLNFTSRSDQTSVVDGCSIRSSRGGQDRLVLVSETPSRLTFDPRTGKLSGVVSRLVGQTAPAGGGTTTNSCVGSFSFVDGCAPDGPKTLRGGRVRVSAIPGRPIVFSRITFEERYCGDSQLAAALGLAPAALSRAQLLRNREIAITGSLEAGERSGDETSVSATAVTWTLTLFRVR